MHDTVIYLRQWPIFISPNLKLLTPRLYRYKPYFLSFFVDITPHLYSHNRNMNSSIRSEKASFIRFFSSFLVHSVYRRYKFWGLKLIITLFVQWKRHVFVSAIIFQWIWIIYNKYLVIFENFLLLNICGCVPLKKILAKYFKVLSPVFSSHL